MGVLPTAIHAPDALEHMRTAGQALGLAQHHLRRLRIQLDLRSAPGGSPRSYVVLPTPGTRRQLDTIRAALTQALAEVDAIAAQLPPARVGE